MKHKFKEIDEITAERYAAFIDDGFELKDILRMAWLDGDAHGRASRDIPQAPKKPRAPKVLHARKGDWQRLRYRALQVAGGKCQCCGATAESSGHPMHVDHIKPKRKFPELAFEFSNLQVLCKACNFGKNEWDETDWRQVVPELKDI